MHVIALVFSPLGWFLRLLRRWFQVLQLLHQQFSRKCTCIALQAHRPAIACSLPPPVSSSANGLWCPHEAAEVEVCCTLSTVLLLLLLLPLILHV
jgi:hypothetical protein